jgi:hypothetical protein
VLVALAAGVALAASARAATYTVGTVSDTASGEACKPTAGKCSLRQLTEYENGLPETKESDVIVAPSGTYELVNGSLTITQSLVILGVGARTTTVEVAPGASPRRVFDIQRNANHIEPPVVGIAGLEIAGGTASNVDELDGTLGGDILNTQKLLLSEDWVTGGTAYAGGGIANAGGTVDLERSLVSGNHASLGGSEGGGILNHGSLCTTACGEGTRAILALEDSTVATNEARLGAGILSESEAGSPDEDGVSVLNSTIAYNNEQEESPCIECLKPEPGAGLRVSEGMVDVSGSIVAFNTETTAGGITNTNCSATSPAKIVSLFGYNLENDEATDCPFTSTGDLHNTSPGFSSTELKNNGGSTDTLAPEPASPAVNAIPTSPTLYPFCDGLDQRDIARPQGAGCDIGAVELSSETPPPPCACVGPPTGPPPVPPSLIATAPPTVLSTTSAAFTTTVNPGGLVTEVHFEYGPVLGASAAAVTYGSSTPAQSVGPDFANHTVTATVTGLLPNVTYNVRAVATNSAGNTVGANQALVTPADPPPPPPVLGKAVNVTPVSGIVYIELPPGATLASASPFAPLSLQAPAYAALVKGQSFVPLTEARQIPVGSILDTRTGVVGITTATTASKKGKLQSGDFGAGLFKLLQGRKQKGLTDLDIINTHSAHQVCTTQGKARIAARHLSSKVLGQLRASGHGNFSARGTDSAATVRGTVWGVKNQCDGTLTHVTRGVVTVRDFVRRKTITLFTGQSYLARTPHS